MADWVTAVVGVAGVTGTLVASLVGQRIAARSAEVRETMRRAYDSRVYWRDHRLDAYTQLFTALGNGGVRVRQLLDSGQPRTLSDDERDNLAAARRTISELTSRVRLIGSAEARRLADIIHTETDTLADQLEDLDRWALARNTFDKLGRLRKKLRDTAHHDFELDGLVEPGTRRLPHDDHPR